MNLKKGLLVLSVLLGLSSVVHAGAVGVPTDRRGDGLATIDFVGALPYNINSATGTVATLIGSGRFMVYGVIVSSVTSTDYLVFRDSATANITSSTATVIPALSVGTASSVFVGAAANGQVSGVLKFPVPIQFRNGISVNASATPTAGAIYGWTILYRPLLATE